MSVASRRLAACSLCRRLQTLSETKSSSSSLQRRQKPLVEDPRPLEGAKGECNNQLVKSGEGSGRKQRRKGKRSLLELSSPCKSIALRSATRSQRFDPEDRSGDQRSERNNAEDDRETRELCLVIFKKVASNRPAKTTSNRPAKTT